MITPNKAVSRTLKLGEISLQSFKGLLQYCQALSVCKELPSADHTTPARLSLRWLSDSLQPWADPKVSERDEFSCIFSLIFLVLSLCKNNFFLLVPVHVCEW